jgi:hypothetical protein
LLLWRKAFGRWALGARRVAALLFSQGHHLDHGAKNAAFAAARASIAKRVEDIGHFLQEGLGDVEAVAADVEEGATVAEAVLEVGQVVADAVEGAKRPDEARGDLLAGGSRPELDSARRRASEGLDVGDDGSDSGSFQQRQHGLPRFRALPVGGKPLLPACFVLIG